jgi:hypothetical protein
MDNDALTKPKTVHSHRKPYEGNLAPHSVPLSSPPFPTPSDAQNVSPPPPPSAHCPRSVLHFHRTEKHRWVVRQRPISTRRHSSGRSKSQYVYRREIRFSNQVRTGVTVPAAAAAGLDLVADWLTLLLASPMQNEGVSKEEGRARSAELLSAR